MVDDAPILTPRRRLLSSLAAAVGATSLLSRTARAAPAPPASPMVPAANLGPCLIHPGRSRKASSYDRSGRNADWFVIQPGATQVLLETGGPGVIRHIWFTINGSENHLKDLILRMYWDGESTPSVEAPVGDFFGLNLNDYFLYSSAMMTVAPMKALNCYWPMPFRRSARVTVTNEGPHRVNSYYSNIDYELTSDIPDNAGYFHAQYRQAAPCKGWTDNWQHNGDPLVNDKVNLTGEGNYVILDAEGEGHYVGVTQGILMNQSDWFGEGDDMIFIDGDRLPTINGTGSEDYYNGAWGFDGRSFSYPYNGVPYAVNPFAVGGKWCLYRWHRLDPIRFSRSIRVTIEHGHANHRSDNFYTVAYWYQREPHAAFPALPQRQLRYPQLFRVGGPSEATPPGE